MDQNSRMLMMSSKKDVPDTGNSTPATFVSGVSFLSGESPNLTKQAGDLAIVLYHFWQNNEPPGFTFYGGVTVGYYPGRAYYRIVQAGDTSYSVGVGTGYSGLLVILRGHTQIKDITGFGSLESGTSATRSFNKDGSILILAADRGATASPTLATSSAFSQSFANQSTAHFREISRAMMDYNAGTTITLTDYPDTWSSGAIMVLTN